MTKRVAHLLESWGEEVTVFHRGETEPDFPAGVRHIHGEFADLPHYLDGLRKRAPEVVLDMVLFLDKAGHGVTHFRGVARRAIVISSCDVYRAYGRLHKAEPGPPDAVPLTEDSPLRFRPAYEAGDEVVDYDNIEVERAVAQDPELPVTILRLPATYGPGDTSIASFPYLRRMDDGRSTILLRRAIASIL